MTFFSGSYRADDVQILLKRLPLQQFVSVEEKEVLIQSRQKHYSEMLSPESLPSGRYLQIFEDACAANLPQMARDCLKLAGLIAERREGDITLVSLARAGTPVGVVLKRLLGGMFGRRVSHYSVSIIRDRGIDEAALRFILGSGHAPESIVFVDGWTGKGVISRELARRVGKYNQEHGTRIDSGLYVLADLAGTAACASSSADYLIPSSILNATVSGLISRSILNDAIGAGDFHGCVYYEEFAPHDRSRQFADAVVQAAIGIGRDGVPAPVAQDPQASARVSRASMARLLEAHGIADPNLIKPGIGEATRVLLRRVPRLLILRDADAPDVRHLKLLAQEKHVPVVIDPALPYQAVSLIRSALDG
ncbi:cysteine protease StiP family protein [Duganella sp. CT11-25]|uniref:cysteine protease StiP family protein n=1 Tax=unclassified Duganella TaxID=2636909 RepID=UPI0039B041FC